MQSVADWKGSQGAVPTPSPVSTDTGLTPVSAWKAAQPKPVPSIDFSDISMGHTIQGSEQVGKVALQGAKEAVQNFPSSPKTFDLVSGVGGGENALTAAHESFTQGVDHISNQIQIARDTTASTMDRNVAVGRAVVGSLGTTFGILLSPFQAYATIPGVGHLVDGINETFAAIGGGAAGGATEIVKQLPLSDRTKEKITPLVAETAALVSEFLAGKIIGDATGVVKEKISKLSDNSKQILNELSQDPAIKEGIKTQTTGLKSVEAWKAEQPVKPIAAGTPTIESVQQKAQTVTPEEFKAGLSDVERKIVDNTGKTPEEFHTDIAKTVSDVIQKPRIEADLQPLAEEARKYSSAEEFASKADELFQKRSDKAFNDPYLKIKYTPEESALLGKLDNYLQSKDVLAKYVQGAKDPEILTEFYNQAKDVTTLAKPIDTSATGHQASRVFERLQKENPAVEGDLNYDPIKLKEDAQKAVKMIETDKHQAFRVAMGAETSKEVTSTAVNIAMAEKALTDGNISLYSRLIKNRSLEQTRRGQEIVAERGSVTDNSTARYVKELIAARLEILGKKYLSNIASALKRTTDKGKAVKILDKEVEKAQTQLRGKELDLREAQALIDSLSCA